VAAGHRLQRPEVGRQRLRSLTQGAAEGRGEAGPEAEGERLAAVLSDGSGGGGGQRADAGAAPSGTVNEMRQSIPSPAFMSLSTRPLALLNRIDVPLIG